MTNDDQGPVEWDEMVMVWDSAIATGPTDVVEAVERMRATWERFETAMDALDPYGREALPYREEAWAREARSMRAILDWQAGKQPAGRVVMRVNAVTQFYETTIAEVDSAKAR